jgi:hypothetical protein
MIHLCVCVCVCVCVGERENKCLCVYVLSCYASLCYSKSCCAMLSQKVFVQSDTMSENVK